MVPKRQAETRGTLWLPSFLPGVSFQLQCRQGKAGRVCRSSPQSKQWSWESKKARQAVFSWNLKEKAVKMWAVSPPTLAAEWCSVRVCENQTENGERATQKDWKAESSASHRVPISARQKRKAAHNALYEPAYKAGQISANTARAPPAKRIKMFPSNVTGLTPELNVYIHISTHHSMRYDLQCLAPNHKSPRMQRSKKIWPKLPKRKKTVNWNTHRNDPDDGTGGQEHSVRTAFQLFKQAEKNMHILSRDMKLYEITQIELLMMKVTISDMKNTMNVFNGRLKQYRKKGW